ncbi:MAG TPA: four helix bundle protein [Flavobacteriales bacterium]|nr:four helix bundle protein [Flavobacteriales bacterium]HNA31729.1 four helix bundle protein [Flavobacteriales bacterium]HNK41376.1 four helix bundle protein [Flavobacteriales bacterium]HNM68232.1 four helix bundle protein [Flavobacteriales bacterium]HNO06560.1 four helix bundle protein [Flavobacteriales bacterium]
MENMTNDPVKRDWNMNGLYDLGETISVVAEQDGRKVNNFKDLWVWKTGMELLKPVYQVTRKLPKEELYGLTSQLRRAAVSVPSNIAEGWGRNKKGYLLLGLSYSRGSLHEIETQLLACVELEFLKHEDIQPLLDKIAGISTGLLRFMNNLESKR